MTLPEDRRPPADPWQIALNYRLGRPWWFDADNAVTTWTVTAEVEDDDGQPVQHVADIDIVVVDLVNTRDPLGLLDGEDADLGLIAETIFDADSGDLDPDLDGLLEAAGSRILVLSRVELATAWRGFGLGPLLAGTALRELSAGGRAAVCYPAPLDHGAGSEQADPFSRRRAIASLERVWARPGFAPFRNGVHVLDLGLVTLQESLDTLRAQAEAHRTT